MASSQQEFEELYPIFKHPRLVFSVIVTFNFPANLALSYKRNLDQGYTLLRTPRILDPIRRLKVVHLYFCLA